LMGGLLHLVQRGGDWAGLQLAQAPHHCTKCNSPPINGEWTNFILFPALQWRLNDGRNKQCGRRVRSTRYAPARL